MWAIDSTMTSFPPPLSGSELRCFVVAPGGQVHSRRGDSSLADLRLDSLTELSSIFRAGSSGARTEQPAIEPRRDDPVIRPACASDADRLLDLFDDLSHPATTDQIRARVARLLGDDTYMLWVAENVNGGLDGFAAGHIVYPIEDDAPAGQLIALVTSQHARGTGIGVKLSEAFERWARFRGAGRAVVNSGLDRVISHDFYKHLGWEQTGLRLGKRLH